MMAPITFLCCCAYFSVAMAVAAKHADKSTSGTPVVDGWCLGMIWPLTLFFGYFSK